MDFVICFPTDYIGSNITYLLTYFQSLFLADPHVFAVAQLVLDVALVDLSNADRVKSLIKDLWGIRQAKLRKSVNDFVQSGLQHAKLDHLELIELNAVRPLLNHTIDHVAR